LLSIFLTGCQSTFKPKLSGAEKQQKKLMLSGMPNVEFKQYIDIMFIKSCDDIHKYIEPRGITLISTQNNEMTFRLPSGRTQDVFVNNLECEAKVAI
jgi:hypothetical protein